MVDTLSLPGIDRKKVILGKNLHFPAYGEDSIISTVLFVTGKRGSGKSWTTAVMLEQFNRLGLQFVCFDALDAHGNLKDMEGVESLEPKIGQSVDMKALVQKLGESDKSLVVKLAGLPLVKQQELVADYCEALLEAHLGKGIHTVFEECQDFIPQMGRPLSFDPIVRLCKLGRALGYGVTLVSQRPAGVNKEALSQAAIYLVHNVINNRDLKALDEQLSFGTDKRVVKRLLNGIAAARKGECVAFAPEYFRDQGYIVVDKIRADRRTEHKGHNVDVQASHNYQETDVGEIPSSLQEIQSLSELNGFEAPTPIQEIPNSMISPSFYPDAKPQSDLIRDKPAFSWDAEQMDTSPKVEYDMNTEKAVTERKTSPLVFIGATVLASGVTYTLIRNL